MSARDVEQGSGLGRRLGWRVRCRVRGQAGSSSRCRRWDVARGRLRGQLRRLVTPRAVHSSRWQGGGRAGAGGKPGPSWSGQRRREGQRDTRMSGGWSSRAGSRAGIESSEVLVVIEVEQPGSCGHSWEVIFWGDPKKVGVARVVEVGVGTGDESGRVVLGGGCDGGPVIENSAGVVGRAESRGSQVRGPAGAGGRAYACM